MNEIILVGRFTKAPELSQTKNGTIYCDFAIAVSRAVKDADGNRGVDFFNCRAWKNRADAICKYCYKGHKVLVKGEMQSHEYEDKEGNRRTAWTVLVNEFEFFNAKKENSERESEVLSVTREQKTEDAEPLQRSLEELAGDLPF